MHFNPPPKKIETHHSQPARLGISTNRYPARRKMTTVAAFTLVEMSIVLIIIGLIVAGIAKGQEMIRVAQVRSVVTDIKKYEMAIRLFDDKYDYLPGDMPNATDYWPSQTGNGNGNRQIAVGLEGKYVWRHLFLAGFLSEKYSGTAVSGSSIPGENVPKSSFKGDYGDNGFGLTYGGLFMGGSTYMTRKNRIIFASRNAGDFSGPAIPPEYAFSIDKKLDDGIANSGDVMVRTGNNNGGIPITGCLSWSRGDYVLSEKSALCVIYFIFDW